MIERLLRNCVDMLADCIPVGLERILSESSRLTRGGSRSTGLLSDLYLPGLV